MSERQDSLQQYVSDMLAVERHILPALESQAKDDRYAQFPEARRVVNKIEATVPTIEAAAWAERIIRNETGGPVRRPTEGRGEGWVATAGGGDGDREVWAGYSTLVLPVQE